MDTTNDFMASASASGDEIIILKTPRLMTKAEALRLAAWLVAIADDKDEFPAVLEAVKNT